MPNKPLAALLIAKMKKKPGKEEEMPGKEEASEGETMDEGLMASSEEILSAVESGSAEALAEALKAFIDQCY